VRAPEQAIERYKSLADIERGFRVLKSEIEIGPVFHLNKRRLCCAAFSISAQNCLMIKPLKASHP